MIASWQTTVKTANYLFLVIFGFAGILSEEGGNGNHFSELFGRRAWGQCYKLSYECNDDGGGSFWDGVGQDIGG